MAIIEVLDLHKSYVSNSGTVNAVNGLSLTVHSGTIFGFLGPNGAGKTTTLRILTTLLKPDSGQVIVAGYDIVKDQKRVRKEIGYVGQKSGCQPSATARENIILQARLYGLSKSEAIARANKLIEKFSLSDCCNRKVETLSGGQVRRVDLAIGIIHSPRILFLDEPTTGLDPQSRAYLWEELAKLRSQGLTIFMSTHYLDEADSVCDRVAIIDKGNIVVENSLDELKRQASGDVLILSFDEDHMFENAMTTLKEQKAVKSIEALNNNSLRISLDLDKNTLLEVINAITALELTIRTLNLAQPSLDEVFLNKTGRGLRDTNYH